MKQLSFESDFNYNSRLASDFNINNIKVKVTTAVEDNTDVLSLTEDVLDLSVFAQTDVLAISHQLSGIPYTGTIDGSFTYLGVVYDLIYNPIMVTADGTTTRIVVFNAQSSVTGDQGRFSLREVFGTNNTATTQILRYEDDGVEALKPSMLSVDAATSSSRVYWTTGGADDPEYFYQRLRINGNSQSKTEIGDGITGAISNPGNYSENSPNIGHTIHSWADTSYTVVGNGSDKFGVIGVNHSGISDGAFVVDSQDFTAGLNVAVASARVANDLYVVAGGNLYVYVGDQDFVQAEAKLDHSGTPGNLAPIISPNIYSGYYFTRMFHDPTSGNLYLLGDTTANNGILPATYTTQTLFQTDVNLSTITPLGTFDVGYYSNQYVFNIPDSQLYMFPGAASTTMFDASTNTLVDTRNRLQDSQNALDPNNQLMGGFKYSRSAPIGYLSIKTSPAGFQDYLNPTFEFLTVIPM